MLGPYSIFNNSLYYNGNNIFKPVKEVRNKQAPKSICLRHQEIRKPDGYWSTLIRLHDGVFKAVNAFMKGEKALLFDLPILTRMISSPGALTGTIISDVRPFKVSFFGKESYLTQSSQLYLEFAITVPGIDKVYCWEKSFRREYADFRHLPEFTHVEYEGNHDLAKNTGVIERFIKFIVKYLITHYKNELSCFTSQNDLRDLKRMIRLQSFQKITFNDAFKLLFEKTKNEKYKTVSIRNFGAYEEVLLLEILGNKPTFVTHYIGDEVAFYHAPDPLNPRLVLNADFLFPGYGELIGCGERVHNAEDTRKKAIHFALPLEDYQPYIESRGSQPTVHSGWGMGIERFLQCILRAPYIWDVKVFPRVDKYNKP